MKKLIFVFSAIFGAAVAVNAQNNPSTQDQSSQYRTDTTATEDMSADTTATQPAETDQPSEADTTSTASQDQSAVSQPSSGDQSGVSSSNESATSTESSTSTTDQSGVSSGTQPSSSSDQSSAYQEDEDADRVEISVADLPATITTQLQSADYTGWTVDKAYKKEKDGQTFYAVKLKQGSEMKKVKFDAQGNVVETKDKDKKDKDHDQ